MDFIKLLLDNKFEQGDGVDESKDTYFKWVEVLPEENSLYISINPKSGRVWLSTGQDITPLPIPYKEPLVFGKLYSVITGEELTLS